MSYDFRPYIRGNKPTGGAPGRGVHIKLDDLYVYPDGHGNICTAAVDEANLPGLNQPFADPYQGIEIMTKIFRSLAKAARDLEIMQAARFRVGDSVLMDGKTPAVIFSTWGDGHFKLETPDGAHHLVRVGRMSQP